MDNRPIGIFDSGVGGLTVLAEIQRQLPNESTIYLGDTARVPYGNRSAETIRKYAHNATHLLEKHNIKALVIACNTASAYAYEILAAHYKFPVIGVIEPTASDATGSPKNKIIGVIGTRGTVRSESYIHAIHAKNPSAEIHQVACPLFVPLAEEGWESHTVTSIIADEYFLQFKNVDLDVLILGCTHYPLLYKAIETSIRRDHKNVKILNGAISTTKKLESVLSNAGLLSSTKTPIYQYWVTDDPEQFKQNANAFLNLSVERVEHVEITNV